MNSVAIDLIDNFVCFYVRGTFSMTQYMSLLCSWESAALVTGPGCSSYLGDSNRQELLDGYRQAGDLLPELAYAMYSGVSALADTCWKLDRDTCKFEEFSEMDFIAARNNRTLSKLAIFLDGQSDETN